MMRTYFVLAFVATTMAHPATFQVEKRVIEIANTPIDVLKEAHVAVNVAALPQAKQDIRTKSTDAVKVAALPEGVQTKNIAESVKTVPLPVLAQTDEAVKVADFLNVQQNVEAVKVAALPEDAQSMTAAESVKIASQIVFAQTNEAVKVADLPNVQQNVEAVKVAALPEDAQSRTAAESVKIASQIVFAQTNDGVKVADLPKLQQNAENAEAVRVVALPVQNTNDVPTASKPAAREVQVASKPIAVTVQVASLDLAVNKPAAEVVQTVSLPQLNINEPLKEAVRVASLPDLNLNVIVPVGEPSPIVAALDENENNNAPLEVVVAGPTPVIAESPVSGNLAEISLAPTLVQDLNIFSADMGADTLVAQEPLNSNTASIDINLNIKFDNAMHKVRVVEM